MARDFPPLSLITPYHVGACSIVSAFAAQGVSLCAPQWIHVREKVRLIEQARDCDVVWAHWTWIDKCPQWVLDRHVVTVLRDPMEIAISARLRGNAKKAVAQARQWLKLWRNMDRVDHWIDFRELDLSRYGLTELPHENATSNHALKTMYARGKHEQIRLEMHRQWECLMVVRDEIQDVFATAGLSHRLRGTPLG